MGYHSESIRNVIAQISKNEIYLPAIQRKFVWEHEQIESLYDSIMRGYPIGMFLFWFIEGGKKDEYTFYKFIQKYSDYDKYLNEIAPKPELKEKIIGVLDGQQRLSSMYIAFQGSYAYKKRYAKWDDKKSYPDRELYLNLLYKKSDENDYEYEFKFLTTRESINNDRNHLWFNIKEIMSWGEDPPIDEFYDLLLDNKKLLKNIKKSIKKKRVEIKRMLRILHQRVYIEKLINYFKIEEQDLDEILDIFIRTNSGGTVLSKSDLLFSTIVAHWEEGRSEIEQFLEYINKKGDGFWFDNDFILRSCLVLTDCQILFKVNTFKKDNIKKIKENWNNIKDSLEKTVDILIDFGFNGENLTSQNAVIPIAYYIYKNGKIKNKRKKQIKKYLMHSLLKQIYGGQGDRVLSSLREQITNKNYFLKEDAFNFNNLSKTKFPGNRTLTINDEDIKNILENRKGPYTFMILSLLYPQLKFGQIKFHQDHIHPASLFTDAKLKKYNIDTNKWDDWKKMKDKLPNLQIMEGKQNISKNKTPFKNWLNGTDENGNPNVVDIKKYRKDNNIPKTSLNFTNFEKFYDRREKILYNKLIKILL